MRSHGQQPAGPPEVRLRELLVTGSALGATVIGLFPDVVFGGRVFFVRDIHSYWLPIIEAFVRCIAEGAWPLWNPWVGFGTPLLADPNLQLAYPPTWLNLILRPAEYYALFVLGHCLATGIGAHLLARRLGLGRLAAFLVGACWCASGPFLSAASLFHHFASAAWLPWVLWALEGALWRRTTSSILLFGGLAAGQLLAGSADLAFMTALIVAVRLLAFVIAGKETLRARAGRAARVGGLAFVFAVLLSAVQWWPTFGQAQGGARMRLAQDAQLYWSVHPLSLVDVVVPRLLERLPIDQGLRLRLFEGREPLLVSLYLGFPLLALGGIGAVAGRSSTPRLVAVGAGLFVLAALGRHTPLMTHLVYLPVFGLFRYPGKCMLPASFLFALLAGFGLERLVRPEGGSRDGSARRSIAALLGLAAVGCAGLAIWVGAEPGRLAPLLAPSTEGLARPWVQGELWTAAGLAAAAAGLLLVGPRRGAAWPAVALAVLCIGDLVLAGRPVNPLAPRELLTHRPAVLEAVDPSLPTPRIFVKGDTLGWLASQLTRGPAGWRVDWRRALGDIEMLRPPIGARFGISGSYDGDFTGMAPRAQSLMTAAVARADGGPAMLRLLRLGSVDYVLTLHETRLPGLSEVGRFPSVYTEPIRLLRVEGTLARSYVVGRARFVRGPAAIRDLLDPGFDPHAEVVLDREPPPFPAPTGRGGTSWITHRSPDGIDVEVESDGPGYLIVTEARHRGWQATVDGRPAPIIVANLLFRCVELPAGRHQVRFRYRPRLVAWGAAASLLAIVVGLSVWRLERRQVAAGVDPSRGLS